MWSQPYIISVSTRIISLGRNQKPLIEFRSRDPGSADYSGQLYLYQKPCYRWLLHSGPQRSTVSNSDVLCCNCLVQMWIFFFLKPSLFLLMADHSCITCPAFELFFPLFIHRSQGTPLQRTEHQRWSTSTPTSPSMRNRTSGSELLIFYCSSINPQPPVVSVWSLAVS